MVNLARRGISMVELLIAMIILGVVLSPAVGTMKRQVGDTRWCNERQMAIQLANELLDYYRTIGYQGMRNALTAALPTPPFPVLDGDPALGFLVHDSHVGDGSVTSFPLGKNAPPNSIHPCLGGPGDIGTLRWSIPPDAIAPLAPGFVGSESDATLRRVHQFRRRVEIFGGNSAALPPPPNHFQPISGLTRPMDCYLVRVTVMTRNTGTMVKTPDQYQVVTVIARH